MPVSLFTNCIGTNFAVNLYSFVKFVNCITNDSSNPAGTPNLKYRILPVALSVS